MRITNSKPTKQAERCQTLIAEKNMNNWIETSGSPFVIVEQQYAHQWKGQENYNAICSVTDYLGKIYIDNHVLLVMGDEPMATRIVNKDGAILIIRWKYAPDYLTVEKLLENDIVNRIEPIEEVEVKWDSTELVLFDSLSPYCEASVKVFLSLQKNILYNKKLIFIKRRSIFNNTFNPIKTINKRLNLPMKGRFSHRTLPINNDNMKWYKIYLNGENRIWKKCITYSWEFI